MSDLARLSDPRPWIDQIFSAKSAAAGGVVRRSVAHVVREIGRETLELEVRRRGYHLIESDGQFIIICNAKPLQVIC
jgi:hypothetical protein